MKHYIHLPCSHEDIEWCLVSSDTIISNNSEPATGTEVEFLTGACITSLYRSGTRHLKYRTATIIPTQTTTFVHHGQVSIINLRGKNITVDQIVARHGK